MLNPQKLSPRVRAYLGLDDTPETRITTRRPAPTSADPRDLDVHADPRDRANRVASELLRGL